MVEVDGLIRKGTIRASSGRTQASGHKCIMGWSSIKRCPVFGLAPKVVIACFYCRENNEREKKMESNLDKWSGGALTGLPCKGLPGESVLWDANR